MYEKYLELKSLLEDAQMQKEQLIQSYKLKEINFTVEEYYTHYNQLQQLELERKTELEAYKKQHLLEISRGILKQHFGYEFSTDYIHTIRPEGMAMEVEVKEKKTIKQLDNEIFRCLKKSRELFQSNKINESTYMEILNAITLVKKDIYQTFGMQDETKKDNAALTYKAGGKKKKVMILLTILIIIFIVLGCFIWFSQ